MANVDRPNGFRIVGTLSGTPWTASVRKVYSPSDNLFFGDIVEADTAGQTDGSGAYPTVDRMDNGATDTPYGVVVGWDPDPDNLGRLYHASSTSLAVHVCVDPNVIMLAQADDATLTDGSEINRNFDVNVTGGSTSTGASNMELDSDTAADTADTPLRLLGAVDSPDNDLSTANSKWLVTFNTHFFKSEAGTTGV